MLKALSVFMLKSEPYVVWLEYDTLDKDFPAVVFFVGRLVEDDFDFAFCEL